MQLGKQQSWESRREKSWAVGTRQKKSLKPDDADGICSVDEIKTHLLLSQRVEYVKSRVQAQGTSGSGTTELITQEMEC